MIMKEQIKEFLPPVAVNFIKKLKGDKTGCIELGYWPESGMDYHNEEIARLVAAKTAFRVTHKLEDLTLSELQSVSSGSDGGGAEAFRP